MRLMFRICFLLFIFALPLFGQSLWQKAVDIMSNNLNWVPGSMTMQFELLDKNGEADMVNESTYKVYLDDNGEVRSELVRMLNDGKDVTAEEKEKRDKERAKADEKKDSKDQNAEFSMTDSPFHPDNQATIELKPMDEEKSIDGQMCRRFDYTLPLEENTRTGTVWLNIKTGAPVLHEFATDPLPPRVKEMQNTVHFEHTPEGNFYSTKAVFKGVGGILFIKKSFRGTMTFAEHWQHDKSDDED